MAPDQTRDQRDLVKGGIGSFLFASRQQQFAICTFMSLLWGATPRLLFLWGQKPT